MQKLTCTRAPIQGSRAKDKGPPPWSGLCRSTAVVMINPVRSIVSASQGRTGAVQWLVIKIGRDLVAGPPVTQIILGVPGGNDDQSVRQGDDLPGEKAHGEEGLDHLVPLGGLGVIVNRIGHVPPERSEVLLNAVTVALQHGILEIKGQVASCSGGPVLALGAPLTAPQRDPILGDGNGPDGPGLSRARSPANVHLGLGLGSKISDAVRSPCNGRLRIGNGTGLFAGQLFLLHASNLVNSPLKIGAEGRGGILALGNEEIGAGRCCGAHRSAHRRRCRKRSGGGRFGDTSSSRGRGCNRSFVYDSGSGCLGTGPGSDGTGRL